jgi:hypothetical protein
MPRTFPVFLDPREERLLSPTLLVRLSAPLTSVPFLALAARRAKVNRRATEIFGYGGEVTYYDKPITDDMLDSYEYQEILASFDETAKEKKPRENIRSWRA